MKYLNMHTPDLIAENFHKLTRHMKELEELKYE